MIHCYKLGGLNIVLDVYSGSVHLVDEVAYDIIGMYETKSREEITAEILSKYKNYEDVTEQDILDCCDDIEELKNMGEKPFRAEQIFKWLYVEKVKEFDEMTNLSLSLREKLKENYTMCNFEILKNSSSKPSPVAADILNIS